MSYLQAAKYEVCGEEKGNIMGDWCASHRIDIVGASPEKDVAYIAMILRFLIGHISGAQRRRVSCGGSRSSCSTPREMIRLRPQRLWQRCAALHRDGCRTSSP